MIEIGIIGALFILIAWVFETIEGVRKHKSLVDLKFALLFLIGTILLASYSYLRADLVFLFLNIALLITILFEIGYTFYLKRR